MTCTRGRAVRSHAICRKKKKHRWGLEPASSSPRVYPCVVPLFSFARSQPELPDGTPPPRCACGHTPWSWLRSGHTPCRKSCICTPCVPFAPSPSHRPRHIGGRVGSSMGCAFTATAGGNPHILSNTVLTCDIAEKRRLANRGRPNWCMHTSRSWLPSFTSKPRSALPSQRCRGATQHAKAALRLGPHTCLSPNGAPGHYEGTGSSSPMRNLPDHQTDMRAAAQQTLR